MQAWRLPELILINVLLMLGVVIAVMPYVFMVTSTLKPNAELYSLPVRILPQALYWENYRVLFSEYPFLLWFWNTVVLSIGRTVIGVLLSMLAGFAFAKYDFRFKRLLFTLVLISILLPFQIMLVPLFIQMAVMQWLNTYQGVILPFAVSAFLIFLARQYMLSAPDELLDAARIDGAGEFSIFWRVVLPTQKPALAVISILTFTGAWNDYLWPLIVLQETTKFVVNVGVASMLGPYRIPLGAVLAGSFLSTLPILIFFFFMQRQFIAGLTEGAVKGS